MGDCNVRLSLRLESPMRLDQVLTRLFSISRANAQSMIKKGQVMCNGHVPKSSHLVADRDELCCQFVWKPRINLSAVLKDHQVESGHWTIPILHDDADVMVINKPFGLVVHGGDSVDGETLVDLLSSAGVTLANAGGFRSGIVHRLDQFTEGLMVIAKSQMAYDGLQIQFKERRVQKRYYAILKGFWDLRKG